MFKNWLVNKNQRGNDYFFKYWRMRNDYAKWYNEFTQKNDSLVAVSILSQNKKELERKSQMLTKSVQEFIEHIETAISVSDDKEYEIKRASQILHFSLKQTFPAAKFDRFYEVDEETLTKELKNFCEVSGKKKQDFEWLREKLHLAFREKKTLEKVLLHKLAIEYVLSEVLELGYPSELELEHEPKQESKDSRGRPLDESADQSKIEAKVQELVRKGLKKEEGYERFWHHEGRYKGNPNKNQLKEKLREENLTGKLEDDAIFNRIDKALSAIGIK